MVRFETSGTKETMGRLEDNNNWISSTIPYLYRIIPRRLPVKHVKYLLETVLRIAVVCAALVGQAACNAPEPTPDIPATVTAQVMATLETIPTLVPLPTYTPYPTPL